MTVECPSLSRFAGFHDSCVRRIESDPDRFNPQLLEFAASRLWELIGSSDLAMRIRFRDLEKIVMDDRIKQMMELGRGTTMGGPEARHPVCLAGLPHHGAGDIPQSADPALMIKAFSMLCASGKLSARTLPTMGELFEGRHGARCRRRRFQCRDLVMTTSSLWSASCA